MKPEALYLCKGNCCVHAGLSTLSLQILYGLPEPETIFIHQRSFSDRNAKCLMHPLFTAALALVRLFTKINQFTTYERLVWSVLLN